MSFESWSLGKRLIEKRMLGQAEFAFLESAIESRMEYAPNRSFGPDDAAGQSAHVILSGWALSARVLRDGSRQVVNFHVPGDIVGLRAMMVGMSDDTVEAITPAVVARIPRGTLLPACSAMPRLGRTMHWLAAQECSIVVEHLVNVGRRGALAGTAHLLLELGERLRQVGLGTETGYHCPLSQGLLADALGLSSIHVNRCLRRLREQGLLLFQREHVTILDRDGLRDVAGFDPDYLEHRVQPDIRSVS